MKTISYILFTILICFGLSTIAQVAINTDGSEADISAILELKSTSSGLLLPRLSTSEMNSISSPKAGLLIFNTSFSEFYGYNGSKWVSLSVVNMSCSNPITDSRDGKTYEIVQVGNQCWMKESMNIGTRIDGSIDQSDDGSIEKYCYDDSDANCNTYGGLYQWNEMMQYTTTEGVQGICPDGWHIPSDDEWKTLYGTVDSQYGVGDSEWDGTGWIGTDAGENLKSTTGWNSGGSGTNLYGFSALPSGYRNPSGNFYNLGNHGDTWSSTESGSEYAFECYLAYNYNKVNRDNPDKDHAFAVRCIRD